jgi:hypothetical protein
LSHNASFESFDKDAPAKPGTKHLGGPSADLSDSRSAAACRLLNGRPGHAGTQHAGDAGVPSSILRPAAVWLADAGICPPRNRAAETSDGAVERSEPVGRAVRHAQSERSLFFLPVGPSKTSATLSAVRPCLSSTRPEPLAKATEQRTVKSVELQLKQRILR